MIIVVQHVKQVRMEQVRVSKALEIINNLRELVLHELLDELDFGQIKWRMQPTPSPLRSSSSAHTCAPVLSSQTLTLPA